MAQRVSFETSQDLETLAAAGMEQGVDDKTLFCTPAPLAASTVARDANKARQKMYPDAKGSFLDDTSRLSLQSTSSKDASMPLNFDMSRPDSSVLSAVKSPAGDSGPDLIQFSTSNMRDVEDQAGAESEQGASRSDSLTDVSSRSSMGLIPTDMLDDLSASVLPLNTPKTAPAQPHFMNQKPDSAVSSFKSRMGDSTDWSTTDGSKQESKHSTDWSDSSRHDSKQDSKDLPMGRSHLDTVKKKPQEADPHNAARPVQGMRGAVALFTGGFLDNVQEGNEFEHSICDVELGAEDLKQLDADFSDLEGGKSSLEGDPESGDEDFGFDEEPPMDLPSKTQPDKSKCSTVTSVQQGSRDFEDISDADNQTFGDQERTLEADRIEDVENRVGEGQESDEEDGGANQMAAPRNSFGLDSKYFHKTPMPFAGDGEDVEVTSSRSSLSILGQQRGAAEGEHLLTKLRRQFMSGDGSEIDTDDELEAARKSLAMAERPQSQGADAGDGSRNNLPMPAGVEDRGRSRSRDQFSYLTRQSGEGNTSYSPLPWDGGGGGDGSSGPDSDDGRRQARIGQSQAAVRQFFSPHDHEPPAPFMDSASDQPVISRESGLQPDFFLPSTPQIPPDSELEANQSLEGSTFHVEDILKPAPAFAGPRKCDGDLEARLDASGFNADDNRGNPFDGDDFAGMKSSFGSFGLEPGDEYNTSKTDPSLEEMEKLPTATAAVSVVPNSAAAAHKSGSFDGPFRKPRPPAKKEVKEKEPVQSSNVSTSGSSDRWKALGLPDMDDEGDNLEKELKALGICCGDDDFQTPESAQAMLAADEKQFEEDHKFSEHHQLAVAAEGLSWEADEDHFSGYLGGEDKPEHLEVSIGTYIAARTETLGTLGGDPDIPRPDFGKPVQSPPQNRKPVKLMSPPQSASTSFASLPSRTAGEGNEDGDETLVSGDFTMHAEELESSPAPGQQLPAMKLDQTAEATLHEEFSSLLQDLTNASHSDMSMEDALSMSAVFNFVKNHNFMKSSDFASAIIKLSHQRKQNAKERNTSQAASVDKSRTVGKVDQGKMKAGGENILREKDLGESESVDSPHGADSSSNSLTSNSSPSAVSGSPSRQKSSRLPVRLGSNVTGSAEKRRERTQSAQGRQQTSSVSLSKSRSVSQLHSQPQPCESEMRGHKQSSETQGEAQHATKTNRARSSAPSVTAEVWQRSVADKDSQDVKRGYVENSQRQSLPNAKRESVSSREKAQQARLSSNADPQSQLVHGNPSRWQSQRVDKQKQDQHASSEVKSEHYTHATSKTGVPASSQASSRANQEPGGGDGGISEPYMPTFQTPATKFPAASSSQASKKHQTSQKMSTAQTGSQGSPRSTKHHHHIPDGVERSGFVAHRHGNDLCVSREEAVGTEDVELMESRQFDLVDNSARQAMQNQTGGCCDKGTGVDQGEGTKEQKLPASQAIPAAHYFTMQHLQNGQTPSQKPALLAGTSLLQTEFAQKYLGPPQQRKPADSQQSLSQPQPPARHDNTPAFKQPHSVDSHSRHPASSKKIPNQPPSSDSRPVPVSNDSVQFSEPGKHPANVTAASGLDDTAMSAMYCELQEDLQQTTMMGDGPEASVCGSFWGKSPLYQSTPAVDMANMPTVTMTASKLVEGELTTLCTGNLVTPRVQRQLIEVQREVVFQEFCCLGVSQRTSFPITNRLPVGVVCRFHLAQLLYNGKLVGRELQSPFEIKPKVSIGPWSTEEQTVLFVPKRPGEHVARIEVLAQSLNPNLEPTTTVVQIHAVAEEPSIQMAPSVEVLDYGDVMWGSSLVKTIKLRNLKRASLPVRLTIWSCSSAWHCFTFDSSANTSDMSIISMSSRPESLGRNVQTVMLLGCESESDAKVVEIQLYCRPPVKEMNRALAERPADQIEARIDVEVDTPVQYLPPLASLTVRATIGTPRLLIPPSQLSLGFKSRPGKNIQERVVLNNSGNISMDLALSVTTFPECFTVSPSRVTIAPGCQAEIMVLFSPQQTGVYKYQSLLLLDIKPEGPSYEIPMEALVVHPAPLVRTSPSLLSSKSFLSFTGVALNQTKSLTLRLFNKESYKAEYATVEVRGATDCFKLVTASGEWQQRCELVIDPKDKVTLTVIFCPTAVRGYSGKLVIKVHDSQASTTKYSIPLSGYGGCSKLTLSGACLTNSGQRWLELGPLRSGHNIMREIILTNSGIRAAFIRAAAFYDMPCSQPVHPGRVAIEPNNFVLLPGSSMKVVVAISPSQREVDLVKDRKEVVAVVRFQHGDEVMRQKYQRALSKEGGRVEQESWKAVFSQQFANDSQDAVVQEGRTVPDTPDDVPAFFHHLGAQCVALLADPQPDREVPEVAVGTVPRSRPSSSVSSPASSVHSRDDRRFDSTGQFLVPRRPDEDTDWTVKPDHLTFTVGEVSQKLLQIINFSRVRLEYEISQPLKSVVPEPHKGEMKPRSSTSVDVSLHLTWQNRQAELPWAGDLTVSCNGQQKIVRVHIEDAPQPPLLAISSPHSSPLSVSSVPRWPSREPHGSGAGRTLHIASTNIHFRDAKVNEQYESVIELANTSTEPLHWKLSAFAPPYVKGADETNTVQRVGYTVFTISLSRGDLLPQETVKIPVKFLPKTKGKYNQHWEVEYQPLTTGRSVDDITTTKISLTAEVSCRESQLTVKQSSDSVTKETHKTSQRLPLQEKQHNTMTPSSGSHSSRSVPQELLLLNPDVRFSDIKVGEASHFKIEFKNSYDQNVQLEVTAPKPPFNVKHLKFGITKRRFLKYPIEFRPTIPGKFEDTMVFHAPALQKSFTVRLSGQGLE